MPRDGRQSGIKIGRVPHSPMAWYTSTIIGYTSLYPYHHSIIQCPPFDQVSHAPARVFAITDPLVSALRSGGPSRAPRQSVRASPTSSCNSPYLLSVRARPDYPTSTRCETHPQPSDQERSTHWRSIGRIRAHCHCVRSDRVFGSISRFKVGKGGDAGDCSVSG